MAEPRLIVFLAGIGKLLEFTTQPQAGKLALQMGQRPFTERMVHAHHKLTLQPARGVEVGIELVNVVHCCFSTVYQSDQLEVSGQDITIGLQLAADKVQSPLPKAAAWS